jgi:hypothetical protein
VDAASHTYVMAVVTEDNETERLCDPLSIAEP